MRLIVLLLLLCYNARTTPLRQALILTWAVILAQAPTPRCFSCRLFYANGSTSLPLLVFIDEALGVLQLPLGLLYVVLITLALLFDKVFIAVTNFLIL